MSEEQVSTVHEDSENFAQMFEEQSQAGNSKLAKGQKISGTIIAITSDNVFVNVGIKVDGVMERKDILNAEGEEIYKVGDSIDAWVVEESPHEIRLTRSMSGSGLAALEDAMNSKLPVEGKVTGTCKGGYTVEIAGKRTFCPGSQMEALGEGVDCTGRTMQFMILRIENHGHNIIVSRRAVLDKAREENLAKVLETIHVNDIVEGTVTRLVAFGAFVALAEGVEGLVHISELAWSRVATCEDAVAVGEKVRVKVLGIETTEKGTKISLSRKQALEDPWLTVGDQVHIGQILTGKVMRLANFGAFVEILPGIEGMVHLTEMAWGKRVYRAEDVVKVGQTVQVKVKDIDLEHKRIGLSIKDAEGDPWADAQERFAQGTVCQGTVESQSQYGIFVNLAHGITGLLPAQVVNRSKQHAELKAMGPGEQLQVVVQRLDLDAHKISLSLEQEAGATPPKPAKSKSQDSAADNDWRKHAKVGGGSSGFGTLGQVLQKALQKK